MQHLLAVKHVVRRIPYYFFTVLLDKPLVLAKDSFQLKLRQSKHIGQLYVIKNVYLALIYEL